MEPRNRFWGIHATSLCSLSGRWLSYRPARLKIDFWLLKRSTNSGSGFSNYSTINVLFLKLHLQSVYCSVCRLPLVKKESKQACGSHLFYCCAHTFLCHLGLSNMQAVYIVQCKLYIVSGCCDILLCVHFVQAKNFLKSRRRGGTV